MVFAVLIHNRQPLDALGRRPGFGNINNPGVKIALFAGQTLINGVGNHMGYPAPVVFGCGKRLAFELILGINVPQAKLDPQRVRIHFLDGTLYQSMRINCLPVDKVRLLVHRSKLLNIAVFGNNAEQPRTLQICDNHAADFAGILANPETFVNHLGKSQRQRIAHCTVDVDLQFGFSRGYDQTHNEG